MQIQIQKGKNDPQKYKKGRNLDVLFGGLGIHILSNFSAVIFFNFGHQNPGR
jgi:hypothetical protein